MKKLINSTTALTMSLALALPGPVLAEGGELSQCNLETENNQFP